MNANGALCVDLYPPFMVGARPWTRVPSSMLRAVMAIPLIVVLNGIVAWHDARPAPDVIAPYSIVGATELEREVFDEIHRRYVEAGLELPSPIRVEFSERPGVCGGEHRGLYIYEAHTIHFCRGPQEDWVSLPKLVIHELAHAWDDHNMTEESRSAYMRHLEFDESITWLDPDIPHDQRPGERFAGTVEGVLQGIVDRSRLDVLIGHG
jgi:hypothetical protein